MTIEDIQFALAEAILDDLPAALFAQFARPVRWLERDDDSNRMAWRELQMIAEPLQELWSQQQLMLNFPALLIHYQETQSTEVDECGDQDHTAFFFFDLILTHPNPEVLISYWFRYAEAIKAVLIGKQFNFRLQITGQRISETGPLESLELRRGLIDVQVTF